MVLALIYLGDTECSMRGEGCMPITVGYHSLDGFNFLRKSVSMLALGATEYAEVGFDGSTCISQGYFVSSYRRGV
jgi:hypothetical protein